MGIMGSIAENEVRAAASLLDRWEVGEISTLFVIFFKG